MREAGELRRAGAYERSSNDEHDGSSTSRTE
jgi:hypothetical protein